VGSGPGVVVAMPDDPVFEEIPFELKSKNRIFLKDAHRTIHGIEDGDCLSVELRCSGKRGATYWGIKDTVKVHRDGEFTVRELIRGELGVEQGDTVYVTVLEKVSPSGEGDAAGVSAFGPVLEKVSPSGEDGCYEKAPTRNNPERSGGGE